MATSYNPKIVTDGLILMLDSANPKSWSQNTFESPRDITSWYVAKRGNNTGIGCTVTQDTTSRSPANGIPMKMTTSGNDAHIPSYNESKWNISSASTGQTWILSVWIKASVATDCQLYLFGANSSGVSFVDGSWIGISSKLVNVTTQWQRFDHYITFNNANTAYIQFRLDGPNTFTTPVDIWWDGVQIEKAESSTALTDFNPKWNQNTSNFVDLATNTSSTVVGTWGFDTTSYSVPVFQLNNNGTSSNGQIQVNTTDLNALAVNQNFTVMFAAKKNFFGLSGNNNGTSQLFQGVTNGYTTGWRIVDTNQGTPGGAFTNRHSWWLGYNDVNTALSVSDTGSVNRMCIVAFTVNYSRISGFVNGVTNSRSNPLTYASGTSTPRISFTGAGAGSFNGLLGFFSIYNRALSDAEVQQNYNALRGRYGI